MSGGSNYWNNNVIQINILCAQRNHLFILYQFLTFNGANKILIFGFEILS